MIKEYIVMRYNAETGELSCYAPAGGELVLEIIEPDFNKAYEISQAIEVAYERGRKSGKDETLLKLRSYMERELYY